MLKAVGLMSGVLDSALAAKVVQSLGGEVFGIHFVLPWYTRANDSVQKTADQIGIPLKVVRFDEDFLNLVKNPQHGYGSAMNPCVDCKIYQLRKAKAYMEEIGADFVFTGEVLGQRPMSQLTHSLKTIEMQSGLDGYLLRPLSAKLLPPTLVEQQGKIDREKLFAFSGRGRSELLALGREHGILDFIPTGGGCLLTDKNFENRLKDIFKYGFQDLNEIVLLSSGRHFRVSPAHKIIAGRDDPENAKILYYANDTDLVFRFPEHPGPTVILTGKDPDPATIATAAAIVRRFSKLRDIDCAVRFAPKGDPTQEGTVAPKPIDEKTLKAIWI